MLGVKRNEGPALSFMGFRDKDLDALKEISNTAIKVRCAPPLPPPGGWNLLRGLHLTSVWSDMAPSK